MVKKLFKCRYWVLIFVVILLFIGLNYVISIPETLLLIINPVIISVAASFLVGVYFQYKLKAEISTEHLRIMEFQAEYNASGIVKFYPSFKICEQDLRNELLSTKNLIIYIAYGSTVINNLSEQINFILSDKKKKVKIAFLDEANPFFEGTAKHWNYKKEDLLKRIEDSKNILKNIAHESGNNNLEIFENKNYPVNYSFYLLDDFVYFIPSKLCHPKSFTPFTIKARRTIDSQDLYGKVKEDWEKLSFK